MKKIIALSVNDNPIYLFTLPLVVWSWLRIGWTPLILINSKESELLKFVGVVISSFGENVLGMDIQNIEGYRSETVTQVSRLYAACGNFGEKNYILTGDADMMALRNYWDFNPKKITVWGHDLTSFQQMPICYLGMTVENWRAVMCLPHADIQSLMKRDLLDTPNSGENGEQVDRWSTDQRIITKKINNVHFEKDFISRGLLPNGYPNGRIDRSAWNADIENPVDCHLPHDIYTNDESFAKVMRMLCSVFPEQNHTWFAKYTEEFKKIVNG